MPEEGGVPSGGVPGRPGRDAAGQPRGNPGPGRPPWPTGRGGIGRRGPVTAPAGRSPRAWSPPARRSPGHAAGRAPVHLPGGVQVHLHGGGGAAWPRAAGSRGARGHRDGHGGGGGRGRGRGGRRRGGRGRRGGLGQLGGRRLLRRRLLLRRRRLRRGLGDPGAPLAAAAPGASGTTARPSAFRHGPAGGGEARGLRGSRRRPKGPPRLLSRRPRGLDSSAQPARSSARARAARTRGASRRAVLALARRCLLRLAPPRHWVGVSGEGAGSPGPRPPHPAPGGGAALGRAPRAGLWARAPLAPRGRGSAARRPPPGPLLKFAARRQPAEPRRPFLSPLLFRGGSRAKRKLRFSGARSRPGEGCRGSAPWPPPVCRPEARPAARPNPLSDRRLGARSAAPGGFFATTSKGRHGDPVVYWTPLGQAVSAASPQCGQGLRPRIQKAVWHG